MITFKQFCIALDEASYAGNIGVMEVIKFYQTAKPEQVKAFKALLAKKDHDAAWRMIQQVTGTKLQGKGFGND